MADIMSPFDPSVVTELLPALAGHIGREFGEVFLAPGSELSIWSLASALAFAVVLLALGRRRRAPLKVWLRALFPRRILRSRSLLADIGFFLFNTFAIGVLVGWAMLGGDKVASLVQSGLIEAFGARAPSSWPAFAVGGLATLVAFLAYELGYYLQHSLCHKVPFLWAFHKTHHTAEVLTPLTNYRVHPIDTLVFANVLALTIGGSGGLMAWAFGGPTQAYTLSGANIIMVLFLYSVVHLQHTQIWLATTGVWGRLILSPAHHQIHHSDATIHYDRNFGSCLAIWDWLFGSLHMPKAAREPISFGVGKLDYDPHGVTGGLITPFVEAFETLKPKPVAKPAIIAAE